MSNSTQPKSANTKIIAVFFPLKPLKNKFSDSFISAQVADFLPKLKRYSDKAILYKIDKERFYTYDFREESFDDKFEVVDNHTIVVIFSVDKSENVDISDLFEEDFFKSVNTIRIHRKRIDHNTENSKPSYIFYTINSTKLLNNIIQQVIGDDAPNEGGKTYFILSANNAKRNIDATERSFSTEKICRMNYIMTVNLSKDEEEENFSKSIKKKLSFQIKF